MTHLDSVDTKELGEVIDMVKDLEEAIYYCTITEAMKKEEKDSHPKYFMEYKYPEYPYPYDTERDVDRNRGRMYYGGEGNGRGTSNGRTGGNGTGTIRYFDEYDYPVSWPVEMRDRREGRSGHKRKTYMESKEMHHDKTKTMKELESYVQELTSDIVEMIEDASPEEKQYLSSKISTLATKITSSGK